MSEMAVTWALIAILVVLIGVGVFYALRDYSFKPDGLSDADWERITTPQEPKIPSFKTPAAKGWDGKKAS